MPEETYFFNNAREASRVLRPWVARLVKRLTRSRRYWRAIKRLEAMIDAVPADGWEMDVRQHHAWMRQAGLVNRHSKRLFSLGKRWGET